MGLYRVLKSQHVARDRDNPVLAEDGKPTGRFRTKTYNAGDVVESRLDLVKRFGGNKFEEVGGDHEADREKIARLEAEVAELRSRQGAPAPPVTVELAAPPASPPARNLEAEYGGDFENLTIAELCEVAAAEEIDLKGAARKAEIIGILRSK